MSRHDSNADPLYPIPRVWGGGMMLGRILRGKSGNLGFWLFHIYLHYQIHSLPYSKLREAALSGLYHPGFPEGWLLVGVAQWKALEGAGSTGERSWSISSSFPPCTGATVLAVAVTLHNKDQEAYSPDPALSRLKTRCSFCYFSPRGGSGFLLSLVSGWLPCGFP